MPKKQDPAIVDDYYSKVESSKPSEAPKKEDKKVKMKVKKPVKKAPVKDKEAIKVEKKSEKPANNNQKPKKKVVGGIKEMTKEEKGEFNKVSAKKTFNKKPRQDAKPGEKSEKKEGGFKRNDRPYKSAKPSEKGERKDSKPSNNRNSRPDNRGGNSNNRSSDNRQNTRTEGGSTSNNRNYSRPNQSSDSSSQGGGFSSGKKPAAKKNFGADKKPGGDNRNYPKSGGKKFRGRIKEEPLEFSRSKSNKKPVKKEEKKVEDIKQNLTDRSGETVIISDVITVKELSEKIGVPIAKLMAEFMKNGMMVNLNSPVDFDTSSIIAEAFDIKLNRDTSGGLSVDDVMDGDISSLLKEDDADKLQERPPVISIMGHVDHGKTSLLDYIRSSKVAEKEAGGITQSIGAYQVEVGDKKLTFLDTPGHEAFTVMRARGAKSTDIAILVVAADEGVKPQTIESISHAKEAGIPVIVAINKMDKEGANPDHVKGQLAEHGLTPDDWGGDTTMVPVSAKSGMGIDDLLDTLALVAEMEELKANPERHGVATVIESHLDVKFGPVSTILLNTGNVNKGEAVVCGSSYGKIKVMKNHLGKNIDKILPGDPALIVGLDKVVDGGDILQVVSDVDTARKKAIEFEEIMKAKKTQNQSALEMLMGRIKSGTLKNLKIVVKADTNGSLEAIKAALLKITNEEVKVTIAHAGVGNINESDVLMAAASQTILVGFNVGLVGKAEKMVQENGIEMINHRVIYHITERIEAIATGMLDPKEVEITLGEPVVKAIFYDGKKFTIAGLALKEGERIENKAKVRVIRGDKMVGKGDVDNLKQGVEDVNSLEGPIECGIQFNGDVKLEEKDVLELYKIEIHK